MTWFYILNLFILQFVLISTQSYRRSSMGEYYVEWREVGICPPEKRGTDEIHTDVHLTKKNRIPEIVGNNTFLTDFDDNVAAKLNFHILGSNLAWLPNAYSMTFPMGCNGILKMIGEGWTGFMKAMGMPPKCPMRKGIYEVKNYNVNKFLENSLFPKQFIYGRYKISIEMIKKNVVVGCCYFTVDVLPIWQKKEKQQND